MDVATVMDNLARFDELDFEAFNKQDRKRFNDIHAKDVKVVFPDGHATNGIARHDQDMQAMFAYLPDLAVESHPVAFGSGDWTCAIGTLVGTFTRPMAREGRTVPPTGKRIRVPMCTVARWDHGRIVEEHLFWDNQEMARQMGVAP
jgi:ketosteroid isomerase-like protein